MSLDEVQLLAAFLAVNPSAGDRMQGTGGCRKLRWRRPTTGKSGGYRVITFFSGANLPVFLLAVFSKSEKVNLTMAERNTLRDMTRHLVTTYRGMDDE